MPRDPQLTPEELRTICEAVFDGGSPKAVFNVLPPRPDGSVRDSKPVRAAWRVFETLHQYRRDGHPVTVLTPIPEVPETDRARGVLPTAELPQRAGVTKSYSLETPALLRMVAIYHHVTLTREGHLPQPGGSPPPLYRGYEKNHEGALLQARDRLSFAVAEPEDVFRDFFMRLGQAPPDPRFVQETWHDWLMEQFESHTTDFRGWQDRGEWLDRVNRYSEGVGDFARRLIDRLVAETGLRPDWEQTSGDAWDPVSQPELTKSFAEDPVYYALHLLDGQAPYAWQGWIGPAGRKPPGVVELYTLSAGPGGTRQMAVGPYEAMERARDALRALVDELVRGDGLRSVVRQHRQLVRDGNAIAMAFSELTPTQVRSGHCWGCDEILGA